MSEMIRKSILTWLIEPSLKDRFPQFRLSRMASVVSYCVAGVWSYDQLNTDGAASLARLLIKIAILEARDICSGATGR